MLAALLIALFMPSTSLAANVNHAECYPAADEHPEWPIKAIYLHGLFQPKGIDKSAFRSLELQNRKKILALARKLKIRIAIPVAPVSGPNGWRNWNGVSLKQIEVAARKACGGRALAPKRGLIGFSNGGYMARKVASLSCEQQAHYSDILILGAPKSRSSPAQRTCSHKNVFVYNPHQILNPEMMASHLASLSDTSRDPIRSAGELDSDPTRGAL